MTASAEATACLAEALRAKAKPSVAGEWKIMADPAADGGGGRRSGPGVDLTIKQDKLDGSVSRNMTAGRGGAPTEQVSKAIVVDFFIR